jgi:hypothetical protein
MIFGRSLTEVRRALCEIDERKSQRRKFRVKRWKEEWFVLFPTTYNMLILHRGSFESCCAYLNWPFPMRSTSTSEPSGSFNG